MRNRKLLEKALRNPQGLRFEEARKLAQALDFGSTALAAAIIFTASPELSCVFRSRYTEIAR